MDLIIKKDVVWLNKKEPGREIHAQVVWSNPEDQDVEDYIVEVSSRCLCKLVMVLPIDLDKPKLIWSNIDPCPIHGFGTE